MVKALRAGLHEAFRCALDWFYPPHCFHCERSLAGSGARFLCRECTRELSAHRLEGPLCPVCGAPAPAPSRSGGACLACLTRPPDFELARAVFTYAGPAGSLVKSFKFEGDFFLGPALLERSIREGWMPPELGGFDCVVPVPLHPRRQRERGYNQAALLGRVMARHAGVPLCTRVLRRRRPTLQQTRLSALRRWENVFGAFETRTDRLQRTHPLLVDDVMTTGATASECARMLKKAGAERVSVLTLVRTQL